MKSYSRSKTDPECEKHQSQCTTMRAVRKGLKTTTYANGSAQMHWGVTAPGRWELFDVKKDPGSQQDLSSANPELVSELIASYDSWWDEQFPLMMARGGDAGDPYESAKAAALARKAKAAVAARKAAAKAPAPAEKSKPQSAMFGRLDADRDGKVTREEYLALFVPMFSGKDLDHDGALTPKEFPYAGSFKMGDADGSGTLTKEEFDEMYSRQFDSRDTNKDGVVTIDEM